MSVDQLGQVNWLAVIVGAALYFALAAIWFTPAVLGTRGIGALA